MKRLFLSLAIITIAGVSANAQSDKSESSPVKLDIGVAGGIPVGNFNTVSTFGIGGFLKGAYTVSSDFDVTLTAGYTSFSGATYSFLGQSTKYPTEGLISVLAGGSYYVDNGFHVDAGIGFGDFTPGSSSGFAYRAGVGYKLDMGLDFTANYNGISQTGGSLSYIGLGISYRILK